MQLPEGYTKGQVSDEKLLLYADEGDVEAVRQFVMTRLIDGIKSTVIVALFERAAVTNVISKNGKTDLEVAGKLKTGQIFYGTDSIRIIDPKNKPKPIKRNARRRRR